MFSNYPNSTDVTLAMRPALHPLFQKLPDGISEFTFANIYLFRSDHHYEISSLPNDLFVITGSDNGKKFFMLPFGLPDKELLDELFSKHNSMKCVSDSQSKILEDMGYKIEEDRDNFDYIYSREDLACLSGPDMHKKKNLLNAFTRAHHCSPKPLLDEYAADAKLVLETWHNTHSQNGDYDAAKEALEYMNELQLCGGIYYIEEKAVGFTLGEENALGTSFVIHFEKAIDIDKYKGLYQYINQTFTAMLPEKYETVNREQDLGESGLRRAKKSYRPIGFVKKYRATK